MIIKDHFIKEDNTRTEYEVYKLDDAQSKELLSKLPPLFRNCYVSENRIENSVHNTPEEIEEFIKAFLPEPGSTMSGDFGEMLSYFFIKDLYSSKELWGPKKWRFKQDPNKPITYPDLIFFYHDSIVPTELDLLVTGEVKAKATKNTKYNPIQKAVKDSEDSVEKIAKTLVWLRAKSIQNSNVKSVDEINRFLNSHKPEFGEYTKEFFAVAIIEDDFREDELGKEISLPEMNHDFNILIICIKDLYDLYNAVYESIPKSYEDES